LQSAYSNVSRRTSKNRQRIITKFQSLSILSKVCWAIVTPFLFALIFLTLSLCVLIISGTFLFLRWISIVGMNKLRTGDMKVPTFYSTKHGRNNVTVGPAHILLMFVIGVVFGGIHCVGWFYVFPSSDEAMLWRFSSTVLLGIGLLFPLLHSFLIFLQFLKIIRYKISFFMPIIIVVYIVSRLILLVVAFISLRHLTPGMLALDTWSSFIPHI